MMRDKCGIVHECRRCGKKLAACELPPFACPWINEDEDGAECEECTQETIKEMERVYFAAGD